MKALLCAKTFVLICAVVAAVSAGEMQAATIIHVNHAAAGAETGVDWSNALTDLQDALALAAAIATSGGEAEIWVAAGTYTPGATPSAYFQMLSGVAIYGGFAGSEITRDARDPASNVTILSGDIGADDAGDDSRCDADEIRGENSHHVIVGNLTVAPATLDGFVITAGDAGSGEGGGVHTVHGNLLLRNVTICGNAANLGGGLFNGAGIESDDWGRLTLETAVVSGNRARSGGGLVNRESVAWLTNVTIVGNTASDGLGGGIRHGPVAVMHLTNVRMIGNSAEDANPGDGVNWGHGGAIFAFSQERNQLFLTNALIYRNYAEGSGGGLHVNGTSASLRNVTDRVSSEPSASRTVTT